MANIVGNNDRCGLCGARHGGNNHLCPVHGATSEGCCEPTCNPLDWRNVYLTWDDTARRYSHPTLFPPQNWGGHKMIIERNNKPIDSPRKWTGELQ